MKRSFLLLLIAGICLALMGLNVSRRKAAERAAQEASWQRMKAQREADLKELTTQARSLALNPVFPQTLPAVRPEPLPSAGSGTNTPAHQQTKGIDSTNAIADAQGARSSAAPNSGSRKKPALQDPLAREALSFVGADPEAERIWAEAINNPDIPPNERKDLIEDLNEDGFPDPKNITIDDLPLIVSRLALIEDQAGDAMDDVNWAAFMEAYKDLFKMYLRLAGQ
jgi:hypothetical protein